MAVQLARQRILQEQGEVAYVTALLQLVDGLPIDEGEKAALKIGIARKGLPARIPGQLRRRIERLVEEHGA